MVVHFNFFFTEVLLYYFFSLFLLVCLTAISPETFSEILLFPLSHLGKIARRVSEDGRREGEG